MNPIKRKEAEYLLKTVGEVLLSINDNGKWIEDRCTTIGQIETAVHLYGAENVYF